MEDTEHMRTEKGIRMIEFFSGIGGMRYGVERALHQDTTPTNKNSSDRVSPLLSCKAYEISQYANLTYAHNFKDAPVTSKKRKLGKNTQEPAFSVTTKLIEQLKAEDFDSVHIADLWTMSPPCQPFTNTKNAKQRDSDDERCKGLKAIITLLKSIENKPRYILLENVKCFIGSHMLSLFQTCLRDCGYSWEEYLLSPMQFGIPNHRRRYYMICERSDRFSSGVREKDDFELSCISLSDDKLNSDTINNHNAGYKEVQAVSNYIDESGDSDMNQYLIPDDVFEKKWAKDLPVVSKFDRVTHCFTAGYSRQIHKSTGSLLLMDPNRTESVANLPIDRSDMTKFRGLLRKFTPTELLLLFGFPSDDFFPDEISKAHQYKLIGNSVNVTVVSYLANILLKDFVIKST